MKKLFFVLALAGIVGAGSINTVSAMTHSKIVMNFGGDEKKGKDKKDCKKDGKCSMGDKKCCHSGTKTADAKTTTAPEKTDTKKVEEQK